MIKNLLSDDDPPDPEAEPKPTSHARNREVLSLFDSEDEAAPRHPENSLATRNEPESMAETVRRSGLAYSAGVALFAAVVFMMVLGWGADLLLGTSPWGVVSGIVLGSIIGFVQFFRLTSQIFKK